jgi:hypothetical protein
MGEGLKVFARVERKIFFDLKVMMVMVIRLDQES